MNFYKIKIFLFMNKIKIFAFTAKIFYIYKLFVIAKKFFKHYLRFLIAKLTAEQKTLHTEANVNL